MTRQYSYSVRWRAPVGWREALERSGAGDRLGTAVNVELTVRLGGCAGPHVEIV